MSTLNVGAMAARLGLDPSEFLDKMKGVEGFASGSGQRIAAEMKRTSREGAESLRLIDEALGIHLSRPVTRIISQEFPALATGLQSLLGAGVFGVVAIAGVEAFEKLTAKIEQARKAQEEYQKTTEKLKDTYEQAMFSDEKQQKLQSLSGVGKKLFEIDFSAAEEARKQIDEITEAAEKNAKAAAEAAKWWVIAGAAVGDFFHVMLNSEATLNVERINKGYEQLKNSVDQLSRIDAMQGTHLGLEFVEERIPQLKAQIDALREDEKRTLAVYSGPGAGPGNVHPDRSAEIDALQRQLDLANSIETKLLSSAKTQSGAENEVKKADAMERQAKAAAALQELARDVEASYAKLAPIANPFVKVEAGLEEMRMKADNDFAALAESGANALELKLARQHLDDFMSYWRQKMSEARQDADLWAAQQALPNMSMAPSGPSPTLPPPTIAPPQLSMAPVRSDLAELLKVQTDSNEAWTKAGQVLQSIETPAEKVQTEIKVLDELLDQGRISQQQYAAAVALTGEQLTKAGLHARELQEQLEKLEKDSTSASSGMKAFLLQIQMTGGENGKFAFDVLSQGLNSFEDDTVKMLEHGRISWRKYFEDLAAMALKFSETKTISMIASQFVHASRSVPAMGDISSDTALQDFNQHMLQTALPLPQALPPAGSLSSLGGAVSGATGTTSMSAAGTALTTAGTTLNTAGASLSAAAAALNAAAGSMSASSAAAGAGGAADAGPIADFAGFFAGGGDVSPGQDFIAGEAGPELIHAGAAGANVTPNSKLGGTTVYNDFRNTVMTDDLMRRAEGMAAIQRSETRMMAAIPTLQREINLRHR
jgi:hypothetical protein